jgi:hypothetical protein
VDYDCFEFRFVADIHIFNAYRLNILYKIAFNSEFFCKYWVIISDGPGMEFAEWLTQSLRSLCLYNVGVAVLKDHPGNSKPQELWYFPGSVIRPSILSPENAGFFPDDGEYAPRWKHLLLEKICQAISK